MSWYVFDNPNPFITTGIILVMEAFAIHTVFNKFKGKLSKPFKKAIALSISIGTLSCLVYFLLIVVRISPWYDPQYFVPIAGMLDDSSCIYGPFICLSSCFWTVTVFRKKIYILIPAAIFVVWYISFIFFFNKQAINIWYINSEIWARYLMGFPGAILSGLGFWRRRQELKVWGVKISHNLRNASITLLIYSVLGGLIVPAGDVFPSQFLNNQNFLFLFHIPVQVARAVSSMFLSWYVLRILSVFRLEYEKTIEKMEKLETLCAERQRIANDIHDGAIQSIYGSGMLLDRASELIDQDPARSKELITKVIERYNETIKSLRRYIHGLKSDDYGQADVEQRFHQMINEYREGFPHIKFEVSINVPIWFIFIPKAVDHTFFITQEALANSARHSGSSIIAVELYGNEQLYRLTIKDNGRGLGFESENANQISSVSGLHGHGINSMQQRSRELNSKLEITSSDQGTQVLLQLERKGPHDETI